MKKNNVNEQRRDFLKKTSLGVAGSALSGGMVGVVSKSAVAKEAEIKAMKITKPKIMTIEQEIKRTGVSSKVICERFRVNSLEEITEGMFPKVMQALRATDSKPVIEE